MSSSAASVELGSINTQADMNLQFRSYEFDYFCGWRYLFSPQFRTRVHSKWGGNLWLRLLCITGGLIGMVISSALTVFLLVAAWYLLTAL